MLWYLLLCKCILIESNRYYWPLQRDSLLSPGPNYQATAFWVSKTLVLSCLSGQNLAAPRPCQEQDRGMDEQDPAYGLDDHLATLKAMLRWKHQGDNCGNPSNQTKMFSAKEQFKRDLQTHVGIWCPIGWHVSSQARMSWWYAWPWVEAQKVRGILHRTLYSIRQ